MFVPMHALILNGVPDCLQLRNNRVEPMSIAFYEDARILIEAPVYCLDECFVSVVGQALTIPDFVFLL